MMTCPHCGTRLSRIGAAGSTVLRCRSCGGHVIEWRNLATVAGQGWARSLKERAGVSGKRGVACPGCGLPSAEVKVPVPAGEITVDFCGGCSTLWLDPHAAIPCVGASGGIAGVLAFYALRFPRRKLAFLSYWRLWVHVPAWFAMAVWVGLQVLTALEQRAGTTNVSGLAHLGGALAGFAAWAAWRKSPAGESARRRSEVAG
jgi:Zn-finger nucleic acid-binding protein